MTAKLRVTVTCRPGVDPERTALARIHVVLAYKGSPDREFDNFAGMQHIRVHRVTVCRQQMPIGGKAQCKRAAQMLIGEHEAPAARDGRAILTPASALRTQHCRRSTPHIGYPSLDRTRDRSDRAPGQRHSVHGCSRSRSAFCATGLDSSRRTATSSRATVPFNTLETKISSHRRRDHRRPDPRVHRRIWRRSRWHQVRRAGRSPEARPPDRGERAVGGRYVTD